MRNHPSRSTKYNGTSSRCAEVIALRQRRSGIAKSTVQLIEVLTETFGPPVATPESIYVNGKRERSSWRVFLWRCPACRAGWEDPDGIYRPFSVDSDGQCYCRECDAGANEIGEAVRQARTASPRTVAA